MKRGDYRMAHFLRFLASHSLLDRESAEPHMDFAHLNFGRSAVAVASFLDIVCLTE